MKYVAFLRGINVGGNKKVPMSELKKALESLGYADVKTLLNSGNAVFDAPKTTTSALTKTISVKLEKTFGFPIATIIRDQKDLQKLADKKPFKGINVTPATRLYVTFLSEKPTSKLKIPYESPEKDYEILSVSSTEICSVMIVGPKRGSVDAMNILEKEFGKNITSRNWNTVMKLTK